MLPAIMHFFRAESWFVSLFFIYLPIKQHKYLITHTLTMVTIDIDLPLDILQYAQIPDRQGRDFRVFNRIQNLPQPGGVRLIAQRYPLLLWLADQGDSLHGVHHWQPG